jgi:hypothetical protein
MAMAAQSLTIDRAAGIPAPSSRRNIQKTIYDLPDPVQTENGAFRAGCRAQIRRGLSSWTRAGSLAIDLWKQ